VWVTSGVFHSPPFEKNWARADELRDKLKEMGFEVQDKKV